MNLYEQTFDSAADLAKYVNDNSILQANIQKIGQIHGRWHLFWWA